VAMSGLLAATIPGARLAVIQGGGHFPNRTHRSEVQAAIAEFLDEIGI
jgi:pimeloyl-ACP methyl ester carboxylesterase